MTARDDVEPSGPALSRRSLLGGIGVVAASGAAGAVVGGGVVAAGSDHAATRVEFPFGEGGDNDDERFDDWADLAAALAEAPMGEKWIAVHGDAVVPAGTWDLHGAGFRGRGSDTVGLAPMGDPVVLRFAEGARLENAARDFARGGIVLCSDSSGAVVTVSSECSYYFEDDAWVTSTDAPFFEVTAPAETLVLFSFRTGSGLVHASTADVGANQCESIDNRGGAILIVALATGNNIFDDDTVRGTSVVIAAISPAAGVREGGGAPAGFQHRRVSTVMPMLFSAADNISYRPSRVEHWPERPTGLGGALDLLAARIAALEAGSGSAPD